MLPRLTRDRWRVLHAQMEDALAAADSVTDLARCLHGWRGMGSSTLSTIAQDMEAALMDWLCAEPVGERFATAEERAAHGATHVRYFRDPQFVGDEEINANPTAAEWNAGL